MVVLALLIYVAFYVLLFYCSVKVLCYVVKRIGRSWRDED